MHCIFGAARRVGKCSVQFCYLLLHTNLRRFVGLWHYTWYCRWKDDTCRERERERASSLLLLESLPDKELCSRLSHQPFLGTPGVEKLRRRGGRHHVFKKKPFSRRSSWLLHEWEIMRNRFKTLCIECLLCLESKALDWKARCFTWFWHLHWCAWRTSTVDEIGVYSGTSADPYKVYLVFCRSITKTKRQCSIADMCGDNCTLICWFVIQEGIPCQKQVRARLTLRKKQL